MTDEVLYGGAAGGGKTAARDLVREVSQLSAIRDLLAAAGELRSADTNADVDRVLAELVRLHQLERDVRKFLQVLPPSGGKADDLRLLVVVDLNRELEARG